MSRDKTKPKTFRLTPGEERAMQELALAGHVIDPNNFDQRTQVGVLRKMLRDAWQECPATRGKPFPGEG